MAKKKKTRNPGMPVVLVNPSKRRGKKRGKRRAKKRRNPSRPKRRSLARRRNPRSVRWSQAGMAVVMGALGGGVAYGINYGIQHIPTKAAWQAAILGAGGGVTSLLLAKFADERAAAGLMGGTTTALIARVRAILSQKDGAEATKEEVEAGALYGRRAGPMRKDSGAVFSRVLREAGAVRGKPNQASSMAAPGFQRDGFRVESGTSRYAPLGRMMGPRNWATAGGNARFVSAHNLRQ